MSIHPPMVRDKQSEIERLTTGPVLRTREGCRRRVEMLSLGQRWLLAWHFGIDNRFDGEQIAKRLHDLNHKRRTGKRKRLATESTEDIENVDEGKK